jgi:hypothetical protein
MGFAMRSGYHERHAVIFGEGDNGGEIDACGDCKG